MISPFSNANSPESAGSKLCNARTRLVVSRLGTGASVGEDAGFMVTTVGDWGLTEDVTVVGAVAITAE